MEVEGLDFEHVSSLFIYFAVAYYTMKIRARLLNGIDLQIVPRLFILQQYVHIQASIQDPIHFHKMQHTSIVFLLVDQT